MFAADATTLSDTSVMPHCGNKARNCWLLYCLMASGQKFRYPERFAAID
jgi:hypothetical protein